MGFNSVFKGLMVLAEGTQ